MEERAGTLCRRRFLAVVGASVIASGLTRFARAADIGPLKIGMVGSGREGSVLGTLFVKAGHPVLFASRHPEALQGLASGLGPLAKAGSVAEAIAFGDIVAIVVPYPAIEQIGQAHAGALAQKALVLDVSNPSARRDGDAFVQRVDAEGGAGLMSAKLLPGARIVRAFNNLGVGAQLPTFAHRPGDPVGVPIAGDNPEAITIAERLIREIGFEPVLVGGLAMGRYLVPGTPLAGVHTPAEIRQIASTLH